MFSDGIPPRIQFPAPTKRRSECRCRWFRCLCIRSVSSVVGSTRRSTTHLNTCSPFRKTRLTRGSSAMACSISLSTIAHILCGCIQRAHASRLPISYPSSIGVPASNSSLSTGKPMVSLDCDCAGPLSQKTADLGYMINHAMFQRNGRSGYVLKPHALRCQDKSLLCKRTRHYLDITVCIDCAPLRTLCLT